jgi:hypothetical protein
MPYSAYQMSKDVSDLRYSAPAFDWFQQNECTRGDLMDAILNAAEDIIIDTPEEGTHEQRKVHRYVEWIERNISRNRVPAADGHAPTFRQMFEEIFGEEDMTNGMDFAKMSRQDLCKVCCWILTLLANVTAGRWEYV